MHKKSLHLSFSRQSLSLRDGIFVLVTVTSLFLLNRLDDIDNALVVAIDIYALKNLIVFSPSNFPHKVIVIIYKFAKILESIPQASLSGGK